MEFKQLEQYRKDKAENLARQKEVSEKLNDTKEKLEAKRAEYEQLVKAGLESGKTDETKLAKVDAQINDLISQAKRFETEQRLLPSVTRKGLTKDEVLAAWNDEFKPAYFEKYVAPQLEKLREAKLEYVRQLEAYNEIIRDYEGKREEAYQEIGNATSFGNSHEFKFSKFHIDMTDYTLREYEVEELKAGRLPDHLKGAL